VNLHRHRVRSGVRLLHHLEQPIVGREILLDHASLHARQIVRDGRKVGKDSIELIGREIG